ncbi:MAG: 2Fe-2S ferredoxin [Bdellovibrio sp.]|nr:MAG: 2Fe-2S ferredoxin [Bdellovibrio sp.]
MNTTPLLKNVWYFGLPSSAVALSRMKSVTICGEPLVFFRRQDGTVAAVRNLCPHRGIPLNYGRMVGDEIECPYHGWRFNGQGVCTAIPSLVEGQDLDPGKIRVQSYPVAEGQGMIWVFIGEKGTAKSVPSAPPQRPEQAPPIPPMPYFAKDKGPDLLDVVEFPCHIDHAVIGLMDPAHGPYIHKSWFWRNERSVYEKAKKFAPVPYGFQMVRHQPSKNSFAYRIFGSAPTTEITFTLPSVRVEHVQVGAKNFVSFTALTPIEERRTRVTQMVFWDMPWLLAVKPLIRQFMKVFLNQDLQAVAKQQDGLKFDPNLMLIRDADTQAKWYYGLKDAWFKSEQGRESFINPVKETTLRWRT